MWHMNNLVNRVLARALNTRRTQRLVTLRDHCEIPDETVEALVDCLVTASFLVVTTTDVSFSLFKSHVKG